MHELIIALLKNARSAKKKLAQKCNRGIAVRVSSSFVFIYSAT